MTSPLKGIPLHYQAISGSDSIDSTTDFPGAMSRLKNLIPMPETKNYWICRPAMAEEITQAEFVAAGFTGAGFISASLVVGDRLYGMIAATQHGAGLDVPFVYDLAGSAFVTLTGAAAANLPTAPATSGAWVPPTMDVIGTYIIVTHPGYDGIGARFFGVFNISDPSALTWTCANTSGTLLPAVPRAVKNFNGRAWYLVNPGTGQPGAYYSDALAATTITAGSQVLTFDDNVKLIALGALPLSNQLGGVIQSLIVFKDEASNMFQITGDAATADLAKNALNVATGTRAPLSITPTPKGLAFLAPDGFRIIDFAANVSDPIGADGYGISVPFTSASVPSRVVACCSADVLRATTQNSKATGSPFEEYWFYFSRKVWCGPHTSGASQIERWRNKFVVVPQSAVGKVALSNVIPESTDTFTEFSSQLTWEHITAFLPDPRQMSMMAMVETITNIAYTNAAGNVIVEAVDQDDAVINSVTFNAPGTATVWGAFVWGASPWLGALVKLRKKLIKWTIPIVFNRMKLSIEGDSASGVIIGDWFMRYDMLGYTTAELT